MSITFIGMGSRSSGKVRGLQLVDQDKDYNFYDTNSGRFSGEINGFMPTAIFVRNFKQDIAKKLKSSGIKVGFDIIDRPVAELHEIQRNSNPQATDISWSSLCSDVIDFYIVTNGKAKKRLEECTKKPVFVIPHHTVSDSLVLKNVDNKPETIGYLGTKDQLHARDNIQNICDLNSLRFYENHPSTKESCIKDLEKIDIGVVYLERNYRTDYVLKYKPNQKLSNFQCFGIPTVICDYESYKEFGGKDSYLLASSPEEVEVCILKLINDPSLRRKIQENGYKAAERLLVKNIVKEYDSIIKQ